MKRKTIAIFMGMMLAVTPVVVFAEEETGAEAAESVTDDAESDAESAEAPDMEDVSEIVMGQIEEITEDSITIAVTSGNGFEMPATGEEGADDEETDETEAETDEAEIRTITLTEETVFQKSGSISDFSDSFSSFFSSEDGDFSAGEDGEAPEQPDVEFQSEADGEMPEMPDGESFEMPGDFDMTDAESEEIGFEDLAVGDFVTITLDDDGNAATVTVQSVESDEEASDEKDGESETDAEEGNS